jgi:hypothetical protein
MLVIMSDVKFEVNKDEWTLAVITPLTMVCPYRRAAVKGVNLLCVQQLTGLAHDRLLPGNPTPMTAALAEIIRPG